jgi:hypothetical protein
MNKLLALLLAFGITEADAKPLIEASKEDKSDFDIKDLVEKATAHQRKLFENDQEFIDKFKSEEKGKQLDIITRDLKKTFGLSSEEIKEKTVKEIIEIAKNKASTNNDKSIEDLQKELMEANTKVKEFEETVIPSKLAEVEAHKKRLSIDNELTKLLGGKKLRVPFEAAYPALNNKLAELYDLDIDEKKQLQVFLKGTKVHPTKLDKTGLLGLNDILDTTLKEWKFIEESNGQEGGTKKTQVELDEEKKKTAKSFPGAQKAIEALEAAKAATKE